MPPIPVDKLVPGQFYQRMSVLQPNSRHTAKFLRLATRENDPQLLPVNWGRPIFNDGFGATTMNNPRLTEYYKVGNTNILPIKSQTRRMARNLKSFMMASKDGLTVPSISNSESGAAALGAGAGPEAAIRPALPENIQSKILGYLTKKKGNLPSQMSQLRKNKNYSLIKIRELSKNAGKVKWGGGTRRRNRTKGNRTKVRKSRRATTRRKE